LRTILKLLRQLKRRPSRNRLSSRKHKRPRTRKQRQTSKTPNNRLN
jgi:hypothetical protein